MRGIGNSITFGSGGGAVVVGKNALSLSTGRLAFAVDRGALTAATVRAGKDLAPVFLARNTTGRAGERPEDTARRNNGQGDSVNKSAGPRPRSGGTAASGYPGMKDAPATGYTPEVKPIVDRMEKAKIIDKVKNNKPLTSNDVRKLNLTDAEVEALEDWLATKPYGPHQAMQEGARRKGKVPLIELTGDLNHAAKTYADTVRSARAAADKVLDQVARMRGPAKRGSSKPIPGDAAYKGEITKSWTQAGVDTGEGAHLIERASPFTRRE